ncbi:hypothetical protein XELAEV_18030549mg, partial [Xenopus laevis]
DDNWIVPLSSVLSRAVDLYNTEQGNAWAFKLLYIIPSSSRVVQFIIKETDCVRSEGKGLRECPFRDGGLERRCTIMLSEDQDTVTVPVCKTVTEKHSSLETSGDGSGSGSGERKQETKINRARCRRPGSCSIIGFATIRK